MSPRDEIEECRRVLAGEKKASPEELAAIREELHRTANPQQTLELPRVK